MSSSKRKLGLLVAIPIKGRKLLNRSGGKQSPYVLLKLYDQKKRTKPSLIASVEPEWDQEVRLDVYQGFMELEVQIFDEGKKDELIGEGILLLHEVLDKGELDVWFPIKYKGKPAGDIYFELTFYTLVPPPSSSGGGLPQRTQHTQIRHSQPGHMVSAGGRPLPHTPMFGSNVQGPPIPYPGNTYQHPVGYHNHNHNHKNPRPYPIPHHQSQHPYLPSQPHNAGGPSPPHHHHHHQHHHHNGPGGVHPPFTGSAARPGTTPPPFRPKTQYKSSTPAGGPLPGAYPQQMPQPFPTGNSNRNSHGFGHQMSGQTNGSSNGSSHPPVRFPMAQYSPPDGQQQQQLTGGSPGLGGPIGLQNFNGGVGAAPINSSQPDRKRLSQVTPLVQYNYTLGSFP